LLETLVEGLHQFRDAYLECSRYGNDVSQTYLPRTSFNVRDVHLSYPRMLREVDLSPTALTAELSDPTSEQDGYVCCHPVIMKLSFTINLSYAISSSSTILGGVEPKAAGFIGTHRSGAMNSILLVDGEKFAAAALRGILTRFGFEVELADSGRAAHEWLKRREFDLILVEFDLSPGPTGEVVREPSKSAAGCWSGTGLIRELRATHVTSPILVHTVLEGELYETASLDAGADDYIVKKAPISLLLSRLHAHLRRRERDLGLAAKTERRVRPRRALAQFANG
jgi:DNA-binding response OmpR family regulator